MELPMNSFGVNTRVEVQIKFCGELNSCVLVVFSCCLSVRASRLDSILLC